MSHKHPVSGTSPPKLGPPRPVRPPQAPDAQHEHSVAGSAAPQAAKSWLPSSDSPAPVAYRIEKGDTLIRIGRKFGVPWKSIATFNGVHAPHYRIYAGKTLLIPGARQDPQAPGPPPEVDVQAQVEPISTVDAPPVDAPLTEPAAPATRAELEQRAAAAEEVVLAEARAYPTLPPADLKPAKERLSRDFAAWRDSVCRLVASGAADSPAVKEFAAKTGQAALVQQNLPDGAVARDGRGYFEAAQSTAARVCWGAAAEDPLAANPLLGVPPLIDAPSSESGAAKRVDATIDGKPTRVRSDVAFVFCPGVIRTTDDLKAQRQAVLDAGFAPILANTGTFHDPADNAQAIADAIRQARAIVGNPAAKVVLVGYSQGATNALALMEDPNGKFADVRAAVAAVHTVHSAAGGSRLADMAFALGDYLTTSKTPTPEEKVLLAAVDRSFADSLGLKPPKPGTIGHGLSSLRKTLEIARGAIRRLDRVAGPALQKLGLHGLSDAQLGKALLKAAFAGRDLTQELAAHGGPAGKEIAKILGPAWDGVLSSEVRPLLTSGDFPELMQRYIDGGLGSLTTRYGQDLLSSPLLEQHLQGIPVLNLPGAVPPQREKELLPPSLRLFYDAFRQLGLDNDGQVALADEQAISQLPTGMNLPPDVAGHWGEVGSLAADASPENFAAFSPAGWMRALLTEDRALGLLD
jgi:LysM repeat protein